MENEMKGWHGSYSIAGKLSAEHFQLVLNKDKILSPTPPINNTNSNDNQTHISKCCSYKTIPNPQHPPNPKPTLPSHSFSSIPKPKPNPSKNKLIKFKYHNPNHPIYNPNHNSKNPSSYLIYNPSYTIIWKRTITGPKWNSVQGRTTTQTLPSQSPSASFSPPPFPPPKCFVNMNNHPHHNNSFHNKPIQPHPNTPSTPLHINHSISHIKAPDFNKTISREPKHKKHKQNVPPLGYIDPNYEMIRERVKTISTFRQKKTKARIINTMKGIESNFMYNPYDVINKVNNHKSVSFPKFEMMLARPYDEKLPTYMMNMFNRHGMNCITNQTLRMNSFEKSKFKKEKSGFLPKRSFNKFVNIKILDGYKGRKEQDEEVMKEKMCLTERINWKRKCKGKGCCLYTDYEHNFDTITYKTNKGYLFKELKYLEEMNKK